MSYEDLRCLSDGDVGLLCECSLCLRLRTVVGVTLVLVSLSLLSLSLSLDGESFRYFPDLQPSLLYFNFAGGSTLLLADDNSLTDDWVDETFGSALGSGVRAGVLC